MKSIDRTTLAVLLAASASLLTGCGRGADGDWRVCADSAGRRVPDSQCQSQLRIGGHGGWVYYTKGGAPGLGESTLDGARSPSGGVTYGAAPEGGVARGGFGSTGEGHGGGGEGGGE